MDCKYSFYKFHIAFRKSEYFAKFLAQLKKNLLDMVKNTVIEFLVGEDDSLQN